MDGFISLITVMVVWVYMSNVNCKVLIYVAVEYQLYSVMLLKMCGIFLSLGSFSFVLKAGF